MARKKKEFRVVGEATVPFEIAVKAESAAAAERYAAKIVDCLRPWDQIRVRKGRGGLYIRGRQFQLELGLAQPRCPLSVDVAEPYERELV